MSLDLGRLKFRNLVQTIFTLKVYLEVIMPTCGPLAPARLWRGWVGWDGGWGGTVVVLSLSRFDAGGDADGAEIYRKLIISVAK